MSPPPDKPKPLSDEEQIARRMHADAPRIPEVELAFAMEFFENVRVTHTTRGLRDRVRLDDQDFAGGVITVYPRERMVVITNPARHDTTRETLTARVSFDNVRYYQPLSLAQTFHYYASVDERQARKDAADKRAREIAAAEAKARAEVMEREAAAS